MNSALKKRIYSILNNSRDVIGDGSGSTATTDEQAEDDIYGIENPDDYFENLNTNTQDNQDVSKNRHRVFGMPHQFLETADIRMEKMGFGFGFFNNIFIEKPLVTLMPGKMLFLPKYSKNKKNLFGSLVADIDNQNSQEALKELTSEEAESRYYDFTSDYTAYMNYVNLLCRVAAVMLGLGDSEVAGENGDKYRTYDWKKYTMVENGSNSGNQADDNILSDMGNWMDTVADDLTTGQRCYVHFYIDPNTTVSESISNTTQNSQLEGMFDTLEGVVKEADMIINSVSKHGNVVTNAFDYAEDFLMGLANFTTVGLFKDLLGEGEQVLHGSNLIFPEIWTDSDYSKSFSIVINLSSPYGDKESIYLNIIVPMLHALCLALPRQSSANTFNSPFLIRGYAQGWFAIDMGMVESITIDKGPDQSWTVDGLPTEVKVTLNIKELYSNLMMSPSTKPSLFFANQGLIDFLGVTCAIDMTLPNVYLNLKIAQALLTSQVTDLPNMFYYNMTENIRNWVTERIGL